MAAAPPSPAPHRTVVVVRHAKAESSGPTDQRRRLTGRGHADAAAAGQVLAGVVAGTAGGRTVTLVSSATRAYETWQELSAALPDDSPGPVVEEQVSDELYDAGVDDVVRLLTGLDADVATVVVVGHNPTMEATVDALASAGDADARARMADRGFPTASVATLTYDGEWDGIGPGTCRLERFDVGRR